MRTATSERYAYARWALREREAAVAAVGAEAVVAEEEVAVAAADGATTLLREE
jgi:hypothetical protein